MSVSRHPIALRLERRVGEGTRLLATVMALPLLDGIFAALVLAGAVSTVFGMLEVGLLIFGGSATLAVVLAEMRDDRTAQIKSVLLVGSLIVPVAALQAALAPTIASVLEMVIFERFAALVILAIAAKTASATVGEYLPSPGIIIGLGFIASFRPNGFEFAIVADPTYVLYGTGAAIVGVAFALSVAVFGPWLRGNVDIDRFRFGSAVALGVLPFTILNIIPTEAPLALAVLAVTALLAFDPAQEGLFGSVGTDDGSDPSPHATDGGESERGGDGSDASRSADAADTADGDAADDGTLDEPDDHVVDGSDRAPWL